MIGWVIGLFLLGVMMLTLVAGVAISHADLPGSDEALLLVVFIVISSLTIGIPVIYAMVKGEEAQKQLVRSKEWLLENNARMVAVLLAIIGVILLLKGFGELRGIV